MGKVTSFDVDHTRLKRGVYVSRIDRVRNTDVVTYDIRMRAPSEHNPMQSSAVHTIEHYMASYLRSSIIGDDVLYFGPMGCLTGFYLILGVYMSPRIVAEIIREAFEYIVLDDTKGIPGVSLKQCGNPQLHNKPLAKEYARDFLSCSMSFDSSNYEYPD